MSTYIPCSSEEANLDNITLATGVFCLDAKATTRAGKYNCIQLNPERCMIKKINDPKVGVVSYIAL